MKKFACTLALIVALVALAACAAPEPAQVPVQLNFSANLVRTHMDAWEERTPVVIRSADELAAYLAHYERYMHGNETVEAAFAAHTDAFFAERFLVLIYFMEGSGSIRHRVDAVWENGDIHMTRTLPEIQTADMGYWHVIIELGNDSMPGQFQLIVQDEHVSY